MAEAKKKAAFEKTKKKRSTIRAIATKLFTKITEHFEEEEIQIAALEDFRVQLSEKETQLVQLDNEIEDVIEDLEELGVEIETSNEYRDRIICLKAKIDKYIEKNRDMEESSSCKSFAHGAEKIAKIKLPKLVIEKFNGEAENWMSFWASFETSIHNNETLSKIDKYNYLRSYMKGSALTAIQGLVISEKNYDTAIEILKQRYGRKDYVVRAHVHNLLSLTPVRNASQLNELRALYDACEIQIRSLESLGIELDTYGNLLFPLLIKLIPESIVLDFNRTQAEDKSWDVAELLKYLKSEIQNRERTFLFRKRNDEQPNVSYANAAKQITPKYPDRSITRGDMYERKEKINFRRTPTTAAALIGVRVSQNCIFCPESTDHVSERCFKSMAQRLECVKSDQRCFLCLKKGKHKVFACLSKMRCQVCKGKHNRLICQKLDTTAPEFEKPEYVSLQRNKQIEKTEYEKESCGNALANKSSSREVLLQTLTVNVHGKNRVKIARVLIDQGSERSYITKHLALELGYKSMGKEKMKHSLFGGVEKSEDHKLYKVVISNVDDSYKCNFDVFDQQKICANVSKIKEGPWNEELKGEDIFLSDSVFSNREYGLSSEINILIGADVAGKLMTGKMKQLSCGLTAIETRLGWTLLGKVPETVSTKNSSLSVLSLFIKDSSIADLWKLETIGITDPSESLTKQEINEETLTHFRQNVKIDDDGRYVVALPWLDTHPPISECRELAERRLLATVNKLKQNSWVNDYQEVFNDWLQQGIIEEVHSLEQSTKAHYLPHRPVIKDSSTTKIRPVFDASAHEKNYASLNNCLEKGPNLLELIPTLLMRFRIKKIGVTSDIRQAFLQIKLNENDRDFLRFLWMKDGDPKQIKVYRHCRVPFGLCSSPFLLGATISYHLENVAEDLKRSANILSDSFYVDNCIVSFDSYEDVKTFISEAQEIMWNGKFVLRDWRYNSTENEDIETKDKNVGVLGLVWNLNDDTIRCDVSKFPKLDDKPVTKRKILSLSQMIFDPIGFTSPVTLLPKIHLQECCKLKLSWDQEVPEENSKAFKNWHKHISELNNVWIPRWMMANLSELTELTLHTFCDASKNAYAACIFLRRETSEGVFCQLVQAKSRISPIKSTTIPRLELLACLIGARLTNVVKRNLRIPDIVSYYWTDSSNALCWIKRNDTWATFVANRVSEIRKLSSTEDWYHIPGTKNPADLPSRGCSVQKLLEMRWWEGPQWLKLPREYWPQKDINPDEKLINTERKRTIVSATNVESSKIWNWNRFSSYKKTVRMVAWIRRFILNCKKATKDRMKSDITVTEFEEAENALLKLVQKDSFEDVHDKRISSLQAFVDEKGLIRTRTKICEREEDNYRFRYPIILPFKHPIVTLLIRDKHEEACHAEVQTLMSLLREHYWILKSRRAVRRDIKSCVRCWRFKCKNLEVMPAALPLERVQDATVFQNTGIDLAGPLFLRDGSKVWIVLFTCAVFRAVHLELVTSLSTESFLQSLRRFIARKGRPSTVFSDHGTNFLGAHNALLKIDWVKVESEAAIKKIKWKFNPPTAAWWGGWWERLIRIVKQMLRSVLGRASLNYEELLTILCDIESVINSRPLTYMSEEDQLIPLTPTMFLRDTVQSSTEDLDMLTGANLNKRWKYRQSLRNALRKRFRTEYLGQLRYSNKKRKPSQPIKEGQIVLIENEKSKRIDWQLGKIEELYPGKDGHSRVAKVRTKDGHLIRPLQRLFVLELDSFLSSTPGTQGWEDVESRHQIRRSKRIATEATLNFDETAHA